VARKKTITREQILEAAYNLVKTEGFAHFTARNIASYIGCSTQPIYLEFANMQELKDLVYDRIYEHLTDDVYLVERTGDPLVDLCLNYISFAKNEHTLFSALYVEEHGSGERISEFSQNFVHHLVENHENYQDLSEEQFQALLAGTWIIATGTANLTSSGTIHPTEEQQIQLIQDAIYAILRSDKPLVLSNLFEK